MLSCKDVCHIVSESLDQQLPWHMRLKVKIHLSMCYACRRMVRQMKLLQTVARRYGSVDKQSSTESGSLSEEAHNRIKQRLQQAKSDSAGLDQ